MSMQILNFTRGVMETMGRNFDIMGAELRVNEPDYQAVLEGCREVIKFMKFVPGFSKYSTFLEGLQEIAVGPADKGTVELVFYSLHRFYSHFHPAQGR